jgi:hypothetical protein
MAIGRWSTALVVGAGMLMAGVCVCASAETDKAKSSEPAADPDLGSYIFNALAMDGRLWLTGRSRVDRRSSNALVSFSLANGDRTRHFRDGVIAMAKIAGHLWVLRQPNRFEDAYWLLEWKDGGFASVLSYQTGHSDQPLALIGMGGAPAIISTDAIRVLGQNGWKSTKVRPSLSDAFGFGVATAGGPASNTGVYVGFDRGEWGGGMARADLASGAIDKVESTQKSAGGFGTVLDSSLDPVNGIIADPDNSDCVIAAVGLVHFMSSGRILRVCGDKVSVVFEQLHPEEVNGNKFNTSDAFFGLAPAPDGYWAVSTGGVYRFRGSGKPEYFPSPKLEAWHGLWISRDLRGVIVLSTDMNQMSSLSGYTPLIATLDGD